MCNACQIGNMNNRKRKNKNVALSYEDLAFVGIGAASGLGVNYAVDYIGEKVLNLNEEQMSTANKIAQGAKVVGGGALATAPKVDRRAKMFGVGFATEGVIEGAIALSEGRLAIAGTGQYEDFVSGGAVIDLSDIDEADTVASAIDADQFIDEF